MRDPKYRRLPWINIFSRWDIISGSLDLYDLPLDQRAEVLNPAERVLNQPDPEAATLLAAHTEYWENDLLFNKLYAELTGGNRP